SVRCGAHRRRIAGIRRGEALSHGQGETPAVDSEGGASANASIGGAIGLGFERERGFRSCGVGPGSGRMVAWKLGGLPGCAAARPTLAAARGSSTSTVERL